MATPTITPMPSPPENTDQRDVFVKKAFAVWNWLKANVANFNAIAAFAREKAVEAYTAKEDAREKAVEAYQSAIEAEGARIFAQKKADEIRNYVIPTEATYNRIELDNIFKIISPNTQEAWSNFLNFEVHSNRIKIKDFIYFQGGREIGVNGDIIINNPGIYSFFVEMSFDRNENIPSDGVRINMYINGNIAPGAYGLYSKGGGVYGEELRVFLRKDIELKKGDLVNFYLDDIAYSGDNNNPTQLSLVKNRILMTYLGAKYE